MPSVLTRPALAAVAVIALLLTGFGRQLAEWPGTYELFVQSLRALRGATYLTVLGLAGYGAGRRVFDACGFAPRGLSITCAMSAGFGIGVLGLASLALGYAGAVSGAAAWGIAATALAIGARPIRALGGELARRGAGGPALWSVLAVVCGVWFLVALCPPIFGDEAVYQALLPEQFVREGRIPVGGDNRYVYYPLLCQALAAFGIAAGVPEAPRLGQWLFGVLLLALMDGWARWRGARGGVAPLLYLGIPIAALSLALANVTSAKTFYQTAFLVALTELVDEPGWRRAVGVGLLLGVFMWVKQVALASFGVLAIGVVAGWPVGRKYLAGALFVGGLVVLPYLAKNAIVTGNPVFPFGWHQLGGRGWNSVLEWVDQDACDRVRDASPGRIVARVAGMFWGPDRSNFEDAGVGVHVLALAPLLGLAAYDRRARVVALGVGVYALLWAFGRGPLRTRTLMPVMPALMVGYAVGARALEEALGKAAWVGAALVAVVLVAQAPVSAIGGSAPYLLGLETQRAYMMRGTGGVYAGFEEMDRVLPAGTRVLALFSRYQGLFTHCAIVTASDIGGSFARATEAEERRLREVARNAKWVEGPQGLVVPTVRTRAEAVAAMRERRLTHVVVDRAVMAQAMEQSVLPLLMADLDPIMDRGGVMVYRLRDQ